jgi:GDPmannose 4,6-dehydratase
MQRNVALITGITGQDGSYLAELLLAKGYAVHGLVRQVEIDDPAWQVRLANIGDQVVLHGADLGCVESVSQVLAAVQPTECYHLGAVSVVSYSPGDEAATLATNIGGTHTLLAAVHEAAPNCRFFFACSSEIFGRSSESPQSETTPVAPRAVYGISKLAGHHLVQYYRSRHGMFACSGILYNHESPRRGKDFVTRKISAGVARIAAGDSGKLRLGDLDATRDWGHAADYVRGMWLMLQQPAPDDYVLATGTLHSVREFCDIAFRRVGLSYRDWVEVDPALVRPADATVLVGNPAKAERVLGWKRLIGFEQMVWQMVDHDCELAGVRACGSTSAAAVAATHPAVGALSGFRQVS